MRHWGLCCVLAGSLASLAGCGWQSGSASAPQGGLAVVDLDEVAKALGVNSRLNDMVKFREQSLNNELGAINKEISDEIKSKFEGVKEQFGEELPPDEAKKLRAEAMQANSKLQQARTKAQMNLSSFTEELKVAFRKQIRPVAQEVAAAKGFSIVIPKNDALLLSVAPGSDITNDVIAALQVRSQKLAVESAAAGGDSKPAAEAVKPKKKTEEKKTAEVPREKKVKEAEEK